jgi:hypothetical protein
MRIASAVLMLSIMAWPALAQAQTAQPAAKPAHPAAAANPNKKTAAPQPARDLNAGLTLADRVLIQFDLAWTAEYNGLITGEINDKTIAAIKSFQHDRKLKETGTLTPADRAVLAAASKVRQDEVGWRMVDDKITGAQIGLPTRQVPNTGPGRTGTRWFSGQGQIQVETFRIREPGTTLPDVLDQQKKQPAGRHIEVNLLRDNFFILSGTQGLKTFYVRAEIKDGEVRGMTLLYDQATAGVMDRVAVAMSSAFAPFPGTGIAALLTPPRRKVEYATGIVVTGAGHIVTDAQAVAGCDVIEIAGRGDAHRLAEDEADGLALLRIYGAPDLAPAALVQEGAKGPDLTLAGIADPAQGGGNAVSTAAARLDGDTLQPAPPLGFDGAAALDGQGRLLGMVTLKNAEVASAGAASPPPRASVVPVAALTRFLGAQDVTPAAGHAGPDAIKAALVRVICVRR